MNILFKDENLIAIEKPVGMPSQKDPTGDADALSETSAFLASLGEKSELFLLHRLDRGVGGVLVFARNKRSAAAVSEIIAMSLMRVLLKTGRHHQIRVQFSSRSYPLVGDKKYGDTDVNTRAPSLFATSVSFKIGEREYAFSAKPDIKSYPWCLFESLK